MLIKQYAAFVARTDQFTPKAADKQTPSTMPRDIAIYGLASEIGSIISALKKELLQEGGPLSSPLAKAELEEELGDAMWYAFALARIQDSGGGNDILVSDIQNLEVEIAAKTVRGARIREVLPEADMQAFFKGAETFKENPRRTLSDYQHLAFKTARTQPEVLLGVCAGVLSQLGAQLMRYLLPDLEKDLNKQLEDRPIEAVLG